jgi:hypothetical protein
MDETGVVVFSSIAFGVLVSVVVVLRLGLTVFDFFGIRSR